MSARPLLLVMKITPGLVGEKAPQVFVAPLVFADLKIGSSRSVRLTFQIAKWKSCTVMSRSGKKGDRSSAQTGLEFLSDS